MSDSPYKFDIIKRDLANLESGDVIRYEEPYNPGDEEYQIVQRYKRQLSKRIKEAEEMKLAEGYSKAISEVMPIVAGIKSSLLGIADEAPIDPSTGQRDWSAVKTDRINALLKIVESYENRFLGKPTTRIEQTGKVDLVHQLVQLRNQIEE